MKDSNARCGHKRIETKQYPKIKRETLEQIPTPAVGIKGLKPKIQLIIIFFKTLIPTPAVGIKGLKHEKQVKKILNDENSNARCGHKRIETVIQLTEPVV